MARYLIETEKDLDLRMKSVQARPVVLSVFKHLIGNYKLKYN